MEQCVGTTRTKNLRNLQDLCLLLEQSRIIRSHRTTDLNLYYNIFTSGFCSLHNSSHYLNCNGQRVKYIKQIKGVKDQKT